MKDSFKIKASIWKEISPRQYKEAQRDSKYYSLVFFTGVGILLGTIWFNLLFSIISTITFISIIAYIHK